MDDSAYSRVDSEPETVSVNGVDRPTSNSDGNLMHSTLDGVENFWEWFDGNDRRRKESSIPTEKRDDSKANNRSDDAAARTKPYGVGEGGRPRQFYHGTNVRIEEFKVGHI